MNHKPTTDNIQAEVDFPNGIREFHHISPTAREFVPTSIERGVWEYFSEKAEQKGAQVSELLSEVLKRDIEINEALK